QHIRELLVEGRRPADGGAVVSVVAMLACATSANGATFAVKVTGGPVRVVYSTVQPDPGVAMSDPTYSSTVAVDADGAAKVSVSGLAERTRYWWRVEDNGTEDTTRTGTFLTPPPAGAPA